MIDFEAARATMVESQLRTDRVTDRRVLAAFAALPRERFVPAAKRDLAYSDAALEVWPSLDGGPARYLLPPVVLARLVQLASVEAKDTVLDIGCATGYSTAVLAHLARAVTAVEAEPELAAAARETLQALGLDNAAVRRWRSRTRRPKRGPLRRDPAERQRARGAGIRCSRNSRMAAGSLPSSQPDRKVAPARARPAFSSKWTERRAACHISTPMPSHCRASAFSPTFTF